MIVIKRKLNESQESKSISQAKKLVMDRLGYTDEQADEFVRIKLRNDLPILRTDNGSKFILGATRMYLDRELQTANDVSDLNQTLKLVASDAHINDYDRNLNGLSFKELTDRFAKVISDNIEKDKQEISSMKLVKNNDYKIIPINSFEESKEYGKYTSWCVTHHKNMFDSYTSNGINQFYFCLKNGFENTIKEVGNDCPLDEYGLSMIAISVNENGNLNTCTCRWNHDNGGNDSIMDTKQISELLGVNFYETFKPNNKWKDTIERVNEQLKDKNIPLDNIFDGIFYLGKGFDRVELFEKYNLIKDRKILSDKWFDDVLGYLSDGFFKVELNGKMNFINTDGEPISDKWYGYVWDFNNGFARVKLNNKYNFINTNGELVSNEWYDYVRESKNDFARVKLNGKWNFINTNCELVSSEWYDYIDSFYDDFACVKLNNKYNFINTNGELVSDKWYDGVYDFENGFAKVKLNNKYNFINTNGKLISSEWYDYIDSFYDDFARVKLNNKYNFINTKGELVSDKWYDSVRESKNGFAIVKLNGKWYKLDKNGNKTPINESIKSHHIQKINERFYNSFDEDTKTFKIDNSINKKNENQINQFKNSIFELLDEIDYNRYYNSTIKKSSLKSLSSLLESFNVLANLSKNSSYIKESNSLNKHFEKLISEYKYRRDFAVNESQESKSISQAKKLVMDRLGYTDEQADEFVRIKLRNDLPILRKEGSKFILGATRMYMDRELQTANDVSDLNQTLKLVSSDAHINDYDRNLNGLSFKELTDRFAKVISDNIEKDKQEISSMKLVKNNDYKIIPINSFEESKEYGKYTEWCVTHDNKMFDTYTCDGVNQFYFCLKNGFENTIKEVGNDCPLDEYGLSMIAISVNENGNLNTCTCRWNHDNGGNDSIMDTKQISELLGVNFYETFKPNNKWKDAIEIISKQLKDKNIPLNNIFDDVAYVSDVYNLYIVSIFKKYNIVKDRKILSGKWYDFIDSFYDDFARVKLNRKWNFINTNGELISGEWYDFVYSFADFVYSFNDSFAIVKLNNKYNFINTNGKLISSEWYDDAYRFENGFAVELNGKWNFINTNCELVGNEWYDYVRESKNGFTVVELNGKWNFINTNFEPVNDKWYDDVYDFKNGFAEVELNNKYNFINTDGKLISDKWYNDVFDFENGFARVKLNKKWNFINTNGKLISGEWYDFVYNFENGFAIVKLNGKWYKLDKNGNKTPINESIKSHHIQKLNERFYNPFDENTFAGKYNSVHQFNQEPKNNDKNLSISKVSLWNNDKDGKINYRDGKMMSGKYFAQNDVIEKCPVRLISNKDMYSDTVREFAFPILPEKGIFAIPFGYASFYRNSKDCNLDANCDYEYIDNNGDPYIKIIAIKPIKKGTEIILVCNDEDFVNEVTPDMFKYPTGVDNMYTVKNFKIV